ncbi:MAG: folylpolyglutamate synthase/dihydrofolate synthase family protein [Acidobacteriota bacterium]
MRPDPAPRSDALLSRLQPFGMRFGLERTRRLLGLLGDPHLDRPAVLIAGTNGKGSTASLLAHIAQAGGYRCGLYTSPHLESVTERVTLDLAPVSDRQLAEALERVIQTSVRETGEPPTSFEAMTIAAFLIFRDQQVDLSILEVGLGGRLDATNVCEPTLSVITSISFDHEAFLGDSLADIAREKAGIMRRDVTTLAWPDDPEIASVLHQAADAEGARLRDAGSVRLETTTRPHAIPRGFRLLTENGTYELRLHLPGSHQQRNAALAVMAAEALAAAGWPALDAAAIEAGVAACRWPGRLEWIETNQRRVLLDVAHNRAGVEALASYLTHLEKRPDLVFGALADKTLDASLPRLADAVDRVFLTRPASERAADPERWLPYFPQRSTVIEPEAIRAVERALEASRGPLVVCGSTYLVGEIRSWLAR